MNNRELENKIASSYQGIAPDILDSVLAQCDAQKGQIIPMQTKKKKTSAIRYIGALAAALALVAGSLGFYRTNRAVASTVMLDVNPGIGISVNKNERVLEVKAYNSDAETVIGSMDFKGSSLDVTVNALIGSMLRNGYISEKANSVLISVDSTDPSAARAIRERLMTEISGIMESENVPGAVLGQTVRDDAALQQLAAQYGITVGKAELIDRITTQNTMYSFADLVPLTINELNLISESGGTKLENIESIGKASSSAYIGERRAKEIAYQSAEVSEEKVSRVRCDLDWEKGRMVYEVDFDAVGYEYEVDVDALTGDVVKCDREKDSDSFYTPAAPQGGKEQAAPSNGQDNSNGRYIGEAAAKAAAFRHAGIEESAVVYCSCEQDHKHGIRIYEVEFVAGGVEYEYDINAETGDVVRYSKEQDDDFRKWNSEETLPADGNSGDIGELEAKNIAMKDAGVTDIRDYECEVEYKKGRTVYEISFDSGGYEYEYQIDAADGTVLKWDKDRD